MAGNTDAAPRRSRFKLRLRDARIRSKLGLLLIIPMVATTALATARLVEGGGRAGEADTVRSLSTVSAQAATVAHELHRERIAAARLLADPEQNTSGFTSRAGLTDEAVGSYQVARSQLGQIPRPIAQRLATIDEHLTGLDTLRQQVLQLGLPIPAVVLRYGAILGDVLAYHEAAAGLIENPALSEQARAIAAWSKATLHATDAHAFAQIIAAGQLSGEQLGAFLAAHTGQREAFLAFQQLASAEQLAVADRVITGGTVAFSETSTTALLRPDAKLSIPPTSFSGMVSSTRWVEEQLYEQLLISAEDARNTVFRQVLTESVAVVLALIVTIAIAVLLARILARSLGRLRRHALSVAERELPEAVTRLSDPRTLGENTPGQLAEQVREPAALRSRDEIGQVAQSFTVVHRAAIRIAAEQAALRTSVSVMFLNLARRSQTLVDRMIKQLDQIERHEEDPKRLARMFTLDHLATRMRRNDENLLILAGADSSPPRQQDALVVNVLRAAQSEVEQYDRIEFGVVDSDVSIVAAAVNDMVRLVAELFDNATRFSPPDSSVVCEARRLGDHVIVQIEDRGLGMTDDQVDRLNAWLATPPTIEVSTFRRMGLAVVARLAARHQIRVELRRDRTDGTIAFVALPHTILVLPRSRQRAFEAPAPRSPLPAERTPQPALPPIPARHLGRLPQRSSDVAHHAAARRTGRAEHDGGGAARLGLPVAGRPTFELTAHGTTPTDPAPEPTTTELPIYREMETAWFRSHNGAGLAWQPGPNQAECPPAHHPVTTHTAHAPSAANPEGSADTWQTAADAGWRAAATAANPTPGGSTVSGLPKRVPQAQLVPGNATAPRAGTQHRTPEQVRGLLSAYHRGVQRGRDSGQR